MTSTEALEIEEIPANLLIVGGGYIGMELGTVYATLGSKVVVVEALAEILAGADQDLVRPVLRRAEKSLQGNPHRGQGAEDGDRGETDQGVTGDGRGKGRGAVRSRARLGGPAPNCSDLGLENTKVARDEKGFIKVNDRQETGDPKIMAIGDVVGGVLLAHKATKEARIAVEVITGETERVRTTSSSPRWSSPIRRSPGAD